MTKLAAKMHYRWPFTLKCGKSSYCCYFQAAALFVLIALLALALPQLSVLPSYSKKSFR